jgi:hypothetical protein
MTAAPECGRDIAVVFKLGLGPIQSRIKWEQGISFRA